MAPDPDPGKAQQTTTPRLPRDSDRSPRAGLAWLLAVRIALLFKEQKERNKLLCFLAKFCHLCFCLEGLRRPG